MIPLGWCSCLGIFVTVSPRSKCSEPTFTPAPADDKVWKYADGTSKGTETSTVAFVSG